MVYKYHQKWRDLHPEDSSIFDAFDLPPEEKKLLENMRRSKPIIPYTLEIECTSYWGNFEREFIAYSLGILDDTQMSIRHSEEQLSMFWEDTFGRPPLSFKFASEHYTLLRDYLLETFQACDDWEQLTFYSIDWDIYHKNGSNVLKIQLTRPLSEKWEAIIIPRMKDFFDKKIYEYMNKDTELISITLCNRKGEVVKEY